MASNPDRASYFPAIEKRYGQPMSYWFDVMADLKGQKYPEQMAYLQENHGFSRAHANALVLYSRGNTTSRRFNTVDDYLVGKDAGAAKTVRAILKTITSAYPDCDVVIAWNKPMVKHGDRYVFGVDVLTKHMLIAPFDAEILEALRPRLDGYVVNKKTVRVPLDWKVDKGLILDMVAPQIH